MKNKISILHLEDQEADSILIKSIISKGFSAFDYYFVDDEAVFTGALKEQKFDIILSDYQLPDYSGMEALNFARTNYPQIPFIFVTGKMGEDAAIESLLKGATDYVLKSKLERLVPAINRVLYEADLLQNRIAADKALSDSEERYRGLLMNLNAGVVVHAPDSSVIMSNPKGAELLGLSEDQMIGKVAMDPDWKFLQEDYTPLPVGLYPVNQIITGKQSIKDLRLGVNRPGTNDIVWLTVNGSPVLDDHNELTEVIISFLDITERKTAEEALQKEQYLMENLMNTIPDHVYFKDRESRFLRLSKSHQQTFLLNDPAEAIGKNDFDFFTEEHAQEAYEDEREIMRTGKPLIMEERETWADRPDTWVLSTKMPLRDKDGNIVGTFGISRDITERKRFEEELLAAKERAEASDRLKTAFIRNISHEILTPLNGILGFGPMLTDASLSAEQREEFLALVNSSSNRLINTIGNIMDISLLVSGNQELSVSSFQPARVLNDVFEKFIPLCNDKRLELIIPEKNTDQDLVIVSDPDILFKILSHLADNAVKFTSKGTVSMGFEAKDTFVEFFVRDTGIGMSKETQKRMYEPFMQKEYELNRTHEGSGLGLSIARSFIELLGGEIRVESQRGAGSTFRFAIPAITHGKSN